MSMLILFSITAFLPLIVCRSIDIRLPDQEVPEESPEEVFSRSDSNGDDQLSFDEFLHTELVYVLMKRDEFEHFDTNSDGMVSRDEYEMIQKKQQQEKTESQAQYFARLFEEFDRDFDMKLNEKEVRLVLDQRFHLKPRKSFSETFKTFDTDGDGALNIAEYLNFDKEVSFEEMDPTDASNVSPPVLLKKEKLPMTNKFWKAF